MSNMTSLSKEQIERFEKVLAEINVANESIARTTVIRWYYLKEDLEKNGYTVICDEDTCNELEIAAATDTIFGVQDVTVPMLVKLDEKTLININMSFWMNSSCDTYLGVNLDGLKLNYTGTTY